jgi:hypothetical protein
MRYERLQVFVTLAAAKTSSQTSCQAGISVAATGFREVHNDAIFNGR